jgi:hypothetical protein
MTVRIRLKYEHAVRKTVALNRQAALIASSLMAPISLMAWALGGWRVLADLKMAGEFAIATGLFSHWQVWIALGIVLQLAAFLLHRFSRHDDYDGEVS